ncbi:MAG: hypothetical protein EOO27_41280, partial [Comamonadaceae bacterium]
MAAHRYWRAVGLLPASGTALELSEFHLLALTTRVDGPGMLTSSVAPSSGTLAALSDDDLTTLAAWNATADLVLTWDLGSGGSADVTDVRIGAADSQDRFLSSFALEWSDNGTTWTRYDIQSADAPVTEFFAGLLWPGPRQKTTSKVLGGWRPLGIGTYALDALGTTVTITAGTVQGIGIVAMGKTPQSAGTVQFEMDVLAVAGSGRPNIGVGTSAVNRSASLAGQTGAYIWQGGNGGSTWMAGTPASFNAAGFTSGDTIGVVVNFTSGALSFYRNGTLIGSPAGSLAGKIAFP